MPLSKEACDMVLYGVRLLINIFDLFIYRRFLDTIIKIVDLRGKSTEYDEKLDLEERKYFNSKKAMDF